MTDDHEPPDGGPHDRPHAFGPTPSRTPPPGVGFRSNLRLIPSLTSPAETVDDELDEDDGPPDDYRPRHARRDDPADSPVVRLTPPAAEETATEVEVGTATPEDPEPASGRHRRHASALSGTVRSTRGRGLRGMHVAVLDDGWNVAATTVTGAHGHFIVEDLVAGTYRVMAHDEIDGDFGTAWHDGTTSSQVGVLQVKPGRTRRRVDVVLMSTAAIDVDVEGRAKKAVVRIVVTDRGTGLPATGTVRVSTKQFSTDLPLAKGRAGITVLGTADGSPRLSKKITVDYRGTKHTQPSSTTTRLR